MGEIKQVGETYMKYPTDKSKKKVKFGIYICKFCNTTYEAQAYQVKAGHSTSCGCRKGFQNKNIPANKSIHDTESKLYQKWESMKARCYCTTNRLYKYYGARGITICDAWLNNFGKFKTWAEQNGYSNNLSIHRIDNSKGYAPDNCTFLTRSVHTTLHNKLRGGVT